MKPDTSHACGNPCCKRRAAHGHLACSACWFALPKPLRDAIWTTWRSDDGEAYSMNVTQAEQIWKEQYFGKATS